MPVLAADFLAGLGAAHEAGEGIACGDVRSCRIAAERRSHKPPWLGAGKAGSWLSFGDAEDEQAGP